MRDDRFARRRAAQRRAELAAAGEPEDMPRVRERLPLHFLHRARRPRIETGAVSIGQTAVGDAMRRLETVGVTTSDDGGVW